MGGQDEGIVPGAVSFIITPLSGYYDSYAQYFETMFELQC